MSDRRTLSTRSDEPIVFVGGHALDCERDGHYACDCDERYEQIFNRCSECAAPLDKWGECTEYEEHFRG